MPMHVEKLTSEVTLHEGELSLTPAEVEKLVAIVLARIEQQKREGELARNATRLTRQAAAPFEAGD
jgi:hypothetical protein